MALHRLVFDCATKTSQRVEMTPDEEAAERARWAAEDAKMADKVKNPTPTTEDRIIALEATIAKLQGG